MYTVSRECVFFARHGLRLGGGRVEESHGHDWRVRATVEAERLDEHGMVMDFLELGRLLEGVVGPLERAGVLEEVAELGGGENCSTERLARYVFERLAGGLPGGVRLAEVEVWETGESRASYREMKK